MSDQWVNQLYFGDNLDILREHIPDESVDLIYLDPPLNSKPPTTEAPHTERSRRWIRTCFRSWTSWKLDEEGWREAWTVCVFTSGTWGPVDP